MAFYRPARWQRPLALGLFAALVALPFVLEAFDQSFYIGFATRLLIFALAASSLNLVLGFGGNEASDTIDPELYEADFQRVVERMRGGRRDLGCLVVAPLDQAGRGAGLRGQQPAAMRRHGLGLAPQIQQPGPLSSLADAHSQSRPSAPPPRPSRPAPPKREGGRLEISAIAAGWSPAGR